MAKRRNIPLVDSDESSENSDADSDMMSKRRKKQESLNLAQTKKQNSSDSDSDWAGGKNAAVSRKKKMTKRVSKSSSSESEDWEKEEDKDDNNIQQTAPKKEIEHVKKVEEEPEEGEVSDSSTSDSSSSDSEFDDGFDEHLMGDSEDRARLNSLSEKERETEIFKRIERRDMMKTRWEIERKLKLARRGDKTKDMSYKKDKSKKKDKKKKEKTKAKMLSPSPQSPSSTVKQKSPTPPPESANSSQQYDSSPEKNSNEFVLKQNEYFDPKERSKERKKNVEMNRTDDKRSNAMALLKAKREGKAKREEEEAKRQAEREQEEEKEELEGVSSGKSADKIKVSDIYSDSGSSDSEEEEKPATSDKPSQSSSRSSSSSSDDDDDKSNKKPVYITSKEQLNKIRLSRFKMERFVNLPVFERTVINCFVRINIGNNNNKPVYRVAEIVGVVETAKIYQLGKIRTNRGLKLKHGTQERVFRLEFISNQEFTQTEFEKWRDICHTQGVSMPTVESFESKLRHIKDAFNYEFNDEDVNKMIEERNRFRQRPTNYAMKKTCLMKERDAAMLRGDDEIAGKLSIQIEELETRANELDKRRSSSISCISYINDRNRKKNIIEAEKAILEESRANKGQKIEDPFTRRITQPRMAFKATDKKEEDDSKEMYKVPPLPGRSKPEEEKKHNPNDYNLYSLHDFDIDLDVSLPANTVNVMPKAVAKVAAIAPKRSLNLEDYKKKRGLI